MLCLSLFFAGPAATFIEANPVGLPIGLRVRGLRKVYPGSNGAQDVVVSACFPLLLCRQGSFSALLHRVKLRLLCCDCRMLILWSSHPLQQALQRASNPD
jgi:hypothetical protein